MADATNSPRENFKLWFADPLRSLYENGDAGFVILVIAFPLLERFLREKSGAREDVNLPDKFFDELGVIFPVLIDNTLRRSFWKAYRNGLLHQVTLSRQPWKLKKRDAWLNGSGADPIHVDVGENFTVHPKPFAEKVLTTIESDFPTFLAPGSLNHPFPAIHPVTFDTSSAVPIMTFTGGPINVPVTGNAPGTVSPLGSV